MASRYQDVLYYRNGNPLFTSLFRKRGVKYINQYATPTFPGGRLPGVSHKVVLWETGTRLDKLASEAYGDATYWWVIARYNFKPTDAHFRRGDRVYIPTPLQVVLDRYL